jgi:hypothetical protein
VKGRRGERGRRRRRNGGYRSSNSFMHRIQFFRPRIFALSFPFIGFIVIEYWDREESKEHCNLYALCTIDE